MYVLLYLTFFAVFSKSEFALLAETSHFKHNPIKFLTQTDMEIMLRTRKHIIIDIIYQCGNIIYKPRVQILLELSSLEEGTDNHKQRRKIFNKIEKFITKLYGLRYAYMISNGCEFISTYLTRSF